MMRTLSWTVALVLSLSVATPTVVGDGGTAALEHGVQ